MVCIDTHADKTPMLTESETNQRDASNVQCVGPRLLPDTLKCCLIALQSRVIYDTHHWCTVVEPWDGKKRLISEWSQTEVGCSEAGKGTDAVKSNARVFELMDASAVTKMRDEGVGWGHLGTCGSQSQRGSSVSVPLDWTI